METKNFILGIVGAAAAGYVLGVLFAPDKGSETRKKIASKGNELKNNLNSNINKAVAVATEKFLNVKNETEDIVEDTKEGLTAKLQNLKNINKSIM